MINITRPAIAPMTIPAILPALKNPDGLLDSGIGVGVIVPVEEAGRPCETGVVRLGVGVVRVTTVEKVGTILSDGELIGADTVAVTTGTALDTARMVSPDLMRSIMTSCGPPRSPLRKTTRTAV